MRLSKVIKTLIFLGGSVLLVAMVYRVDFSDLLESLYLMGPWLLLYGLLRVVPIVLHAVAWAACFPERQLPLPLWQLVLVRQAGDAINSLTPTADIGGEMTKVLLLESVLPREHAMAAVIIELGSTTLAKMIYLSLGMWYMTQHLPLPTELLVSLILSIGLISLGLLGFIVCQRYGLLSAVVQWVSRLSIGLRRLQWLGHHLARVDEQLVAYYTCHPWRFARSLGLHFIAYACDIVTIYVLLYFILGEGAPGLVTSSMIAIAVVAIDQMFFFVPGGIGTLEGARFLVLSALGMSHIYGLAFGIVGRMERLVASVFGMLAYALINRLLSPAQTPR